MMALNTAVGQLKQFKTEVDALIASGMLKEKLL